jgi:hypothetical protein
MRSAVIALFVLRAVVGSAQEAVYRVSGDQLPVEVVANGYVQSVIPVAPGSVEARVATDLGPIGSTGSYAEVALRERPHAVPADFQLPRRLQADLQPHLSAWEAATRVLEWTSAAITVDTTDTGDQDAQSVLARGRGRCSGVANAAAALLMAAGFESTTVSGLLVTEDGWIPHRWVACRLPGAGWVHTDPTLGLWTLTPQHLAFADSVVGRPEVRVVAAGRTELGRLPRRAGQPMRPDVGSDLVCRLLGQPARGVAVATLHGEGGEVHRASLDPEGWFTALLPGRWRLVVTLGAVTLEDTELDLRPGQVHSFAVTLPEDAVRSEVGS